MGQTATFRVVPAVVVALITLPMVISAIGGGDGTTAGDERRNTTESEPNRTGGCEVGGCEDCEPASNEGQVSPAAGPPPPHVTVSDQQQIKK